MEKRLKIYNTLSNRLEEFKPINPPEVGIYVCGPTVYDYTHLGHLRAYINADVLIRTLRFFDFEPKVVMNITDVGHLTSDRSSGEDKMEKKAREEEKDIWEIAEKYTQYFWNSLEKVNVKKPDIIAKATDHIQEMIDLVKKLEKKGYTYKINDGIYFDTSKLNDYGKLADIDIEGLKEGARVEKNPEKKNSTDFALWKFSPKDEKRQMEWDSNWGTGFPGWHIECSAMGMKYLGEQFDIHLGGIEHIRVHHTNEIAQSEAATGKKPFVKYWMHTEHLLIEGEKMSKSLKNFYRLDDLTEKGYNPLALRYLYLTSHYKSRMNFTWDSLDSAQTALENLYQIVEEAKSTKRTTLSEKKLRKVNLYREQFDEALKDDLKTPVAISVLWQAAKSNIPARDKRELLLYFDEVLGLDLENPDFEKKVFSLDEIEDQEIIKLAKKRESLRNEEKWDEADDVRGKIEKKGWKLKDTSQGTKLEKK